MTKEALTLALEALQAVQPECDDFHHKKKEMHDWSETCMPLERYNKAITAIKEALAQTEQEPVALEAVYETIIHWDEGGGKRSRRELARRIVSLYTTPPQRTWVGLTPQERDEINEQVYGAVPHHVAFHHAIEAKLKEKNSA